MKNVMPMQPYLVLDTDDYEVKKEMKSGISHFYEFSKKKNSKVEMKAVPDGIQKLENYLRERIYDTDGCICIRQLAEETGYSECYIRRVFQQVHGISPKNFERFVRFQKLLHVINKMPEMIRLDALAQQCGYYDEAHMIKDFKQYAGITPQGYERLITGTKIPELEL